MTDNRQAIDDHTLLNANTGLPKHIYHYNYPHRTDKSIRGSFRYKGKKYHTVTFYYKEGHLEDAVELCQIALNHMKDGIEGYREYVESEGYREKARQKSKNEYTNSVHAENGGSASTSVESIRSEFHIRHIGSDGEL